MTRKKTHKEKGSMPSAAKKLAGKLSLAPSENPAG